VSPASGDSLGKWGSPISCQHLVSIQLVSPASGDGVGTVGAVVSYETETFPFNWCPQRVGTAMTGTSPGGTSPVSIQLVSPASGDLVHDGSGQETTGHRFHSIGVPSEWGLPSTHLFAYLPASVSIQLVSPASGDFKSRRSVYAHNPVGSFHSIGVPSEWGPGLMGATWAIFRVMFPFNWCPQRVGTNCGRRMLLESSNVSIQLVSPASGDQSPMPTLGHGELVSIQLVSPASGDAL